MKGGGGEENLREQRINSADDWELREMDDGNQKSAVETGKGKEKREEGKRIIRH